MKRRSTNTKGKLSHKTAWLGNLGYLLQRCMWKGIHQELLPMRLPRKVMCIGNFILLCSIRIFELHRVILIAYWIALSYRLLPALESTLWTARALSPSVQVDSGIITPNFKGLLQHAYSESSNECNPLSKTCEDSTMNSMDQPVP